MPATPPAVRRRRGVVVLICLPFRCQGRGGGGDLVLGADVLVVLGVSSRLLVGFAASVGETNTRQAIAL